MEIEELAKRVAFVLMDNEYKMATAEECTCGLLGACIASQPYAQRWYKGGIVAYDEESAMKMFKIQSYTIERNDFVSSQVAQQMALETLQKYNANICTSIVGYVDGSGSANVPMGEAQICVAKYDGKSFSFRYRKLKLNKMNTKSQNIEQCLDEALRLTLEHIIGE